MFDEETLRSAAEIPGYCGPLFDDRPRLSTAKLRPIVWGILLGWGAVRPHEVCTSIAHLCNEDDLRCVDDDSTPLETLVLAVLSDFGARGVVRINADGLYVLNVPNCLSQVLSICCLLDAELPPHLLNDLAKHYLAHGKPRQGTDAEAPSPLAGSPQAV